MKPPLQQNSQHDKNVFITSLVGLVEVVERFGVVLEEGGVEAAGDVRAAGADRGGGGLDGVDHALGQTGHLAGLVFSVMYSTYWL